MESQTGQETAVKKITRKTRKGKLLSRGRVLMLALCASGLLGCVGYTWLTQDVVAQLAFLRQRNSGHGPGGGRKAIVSSAAWQTARTLQPMAVSSEEQEYAREAERLADHEVDQAFAVALRLASLRAQHVALGGSAQAAAQKVAQLEQVVKQDRQQVRQLGGDAVENAAAANDAAKKSAEKAGTDKDVLDLARAQLNLDSGELDDARRGLAQMVGDNSDQIQEELNAYHMAQQLAQNNANAVGERAVTSEKKHRTLTMRLKVLKQQDERADLLEQAAAAAAAEQASLGGERAAAEKKLDDALAAGSGQSQLEQLKDRSSKRQILDIYDDRIEMDKELVAVYDKWRSQVAMQHRIVTHMIAVSLEWIFVTILATMLVGIAGEKILDRFRLDNRQTHTLRTIVRLGLQIGCVVIVLLIIFGAPQQISTVLGLTTAALTIALQDFVLAFFGWFLLMGRNGIHVGDWVEINGVHGEVVEVGLFSTALLELSSLTSKGRPTGRRISFLNSFAIRGQYFNFSTSSQWMWDEVRVGIPKNLDIHQVASEIEKLVQEKTAESAREAEHDWMRVEHGSSLTNMATASNISMRPTTEGIEATVHYVTRATDRFATRDRLYLQLLELLQKKQEVAK
jgi:small-conductance mechanosensitive channel